MHPFKKITTLLDSMESLITEEEFDIKNQECSTLNKNIAAELEKLSPLWGDSPAYVKVQDKFNKLCNTYEPIEEDERSIRAMMYPEGEEDDGFL